MLLAAVFLAITGASILIANRWYGDPLYVQIFFGIVMGGWILKFVVFIVVLLVLRGQPWLNADGVLRRGRGERASPRSPIDVVVMLRMRIPHVSDIELPTDRTPDDAVGDAHDAIE